MKMETALSGAVQEKTFPCFVMLNDDLTFRLRKTKPGSLGGYSGFSRAVVVFSSAAKTAVFACMLVIFFLHTLDDPGLVWGGRTEAAKTSLAAPLFFASFFSLGLVVIVTGIVILYPDIYVSIIAFIDATKEQQVPATSLEIP